MSTTPEQELPTSDDWDAAGFTPEQAIQLQRLTIALLAMTHEQWAALNKMMDRMRPEVWLS